MKTAIAWALYLLFGAALPGAHAQEANWQSQRLQLIDEIRADVRRTEDYTGIHELDERVMAAMQDVPRSRPRAPSS